MPNAVLVDNPFGNNSLDKILAVIKHGEWEMNIQLPELGKNFSVTGMNSGNEKEFTASGNSFSIEPGTYILSKNGKKAKASYKGWPADDLKAFFAPETTVDKTYLIHEPVPSLTAGQNYKIEATIVSNDPVEQVQAWLRNGNTYESLDLQEEKAYTYRASVPEELLKKGFLEYRIIVTTPEGTTTFPGGKQGNPGQWDFDPDQPYSVRIVNYEAPVFLFDVARDHEDVVRKWLPTNNLVPTENPGEAEFQVNIEKLFEVDPENTKAQAVYDYSFRYNFEKKIKGRREAVEGKDRLVLKARALNDKPVKLQVALVMNNGSSFGKILELDPKLEEYEIDLSTLEPVKTVTLPRPYPTFLPLYFEHNIQETFDLEEAESLQFSIGPGLSESERQKQHGVGIVSVRLE